MFQAVSVCLFQHYQLHNDIFHLIIQMSANFYLIQVLIPGIYLPECIEIVQCNVLFSWVFLLPIWCLDVVCLFQYFETLSEDDVQCGLLPPLIIYPRGQSYPPYCGSHQEWNHLISLILITTYLILLSKNMLTKMQAVCPVQVQHMSL